MRILLQTFMLLAVIACAAPVLAQEPVEPPEATSENPPENPTENPPEPAAPRYQAKGSSFVTGSVSEDQAIRMAKGEARAKVLEQALGTALTSQTLVRDFQFIGQTVIGTALGITRDEIWQIDRELIGDTFVIHADLEAAVEPLRGDEAPTVNAELDKNAYKMGEEMSLTVETGEKAYVAIYSRDAEDLITRLHPSTETEAVELDPSETLTLPRDNQIMIAEPREGRQRDEELIVVVASSRPFKADWLAKGTVMKSADDQAAAAASYETFIDKLAQLNLRYVTMVSVPFMVER